MPLPKNKKAKLTTKKKILKECNPVESDLFISEELEFNDDGECIGDDTWDYPGSPYLTEDSDIY